uniref:multiubiquitin domain-containing protein n=1 Tax=uncultured Draconibacterium sp. TaxID=1573823 RepID=UPI003217517B
MENLNKKDHENHGKDTKKILIEGTLYEWAEEMISFAQVITFRYGSYDPSKTYSVSYEDGPKENREGVLKAGQSVYIKNKMIFHATGGYKS